MSGLRSAEVTLPTEEQVLITREFDADRRRVFDAWTKPELIERWWHAKRGKVTITEVDLRVGGRWRWGMATHEGFEFAFSGEYREIVQNERLVFTEVYEPTGGEGSVNTLTLQEHDGRTLLTLLVQHASRAERDMHVESGMEDGLQDALDLLEEVAASPE
jgi:uncharacterized protein YndB with AHSA1/START domain